MIINLKKQGRSVGAIDVNESLTASDLVRLRQLWIEYLQSRQEVFYDLAWAFAQHLNKTGVYEAKPTFIVDIDFVGA